MVMAVKCPRAWALPAALLAPPEHRGDALARAQDRLVEAPGLFRGRPDRLCRQPLPCQRGDKPRHQILPI